jgi:molybdopterin-guanine dinucleotide biosynthesis protein A
VALNPRVTAIVLAGGPHDEIAALAPGAPNKAFVPIAGKTLVARTLAALRSAPSVDKIVVVAPVAMHASPELAEADEMRPDGRTMLESLRSGLGSAPPEELVLVCASDLPVLSAVAVEEFLGLAVASGADVVYACVERRTHVARYPGVPHTWARFQEGTYCGAGCASLRPRVLPALDGLLGRLGAARKNPLRLASIFGARVLARYAFGLLTIARAERRASELLGWHAAAAICSHPEIAVNVDTKGDVSIAEGLVAASSMATSPFTT